MQWNKKRKSIIIVYCRKAFWKITTHACTRLVLPVRFEKDHLNVGEKTVQTGVCPTDNILRRHYLTAESWLIRFEVLYDDEVSNRKRI